MCLAFELLRENAFGEIAATIKQCRQGDVLGLDHFDPGDFPEFLIVGDGVDRAQARFDDFKSDLGGMRQERAAPPAGPEGADRVPRSSETSLMASASNGWP